jgi:hypothetical protein
MCREEERMARVMITGGFGTIGRWVLRELRRQHYHVTVFDLGTPRSNHWKRGDVFSSSWTARTAGRPRVSRFAPCARSPCWSERVCAMRIACSGNSPVVNREPG